MNDKFVYINIDMNNDSKKVKVLWNTKWKTYVTNFNKLRNIITDGNRFKPHHYPIQNRQSERF